MRTGKSEPVRNLPDRLELHGLREEPKRCEEAVLAEQLHARTDVCARERLEASYWEEDRALAFERFANSCEWHAIKRLFETLGVGPNKRIVELGGGGGWLAWALSSSGHRHVELVEPNGEFVTGTGYLRTRADARRIRIWNDLDAWYASPQTYDVVLTHNCVHHFGHLPMIAAAVRQHMVPLGRWIMLREWYAESSADFYGKLAAHPYSQRYGLFESPYPVTHYVDSLQLAGLALTAVVPSGYVGGALESFTEAPPTAMNAAYSRTVDWALRATPKLTTKLYRMEHVAQTFSGGRGRRFTRPGALVFVRPEWG